MADDWRASTWGDEISLEYGKALRSHETAQGRYRVFGSNGPIGWTDQYLAPGPGVILGRKGAYRGVKFSRDPFFVIDTAYYVVPKTQLDMRWLYYAIKHYRLGEIDDGSPIPSTTRAAVYILDLDVPPPQEQRAIAHILGTLDDKIELNRRMSETLEGMARALFESWFVDFDPVRARAQGRFPGLPTAIADLFPDSFEDSELGQIPKGWAVKPLSDCVDIARGLSYKGSGLSERGVPMHNLNSIYEGGGYKYDGLKRYDGDYKSQHVARAGDLIVANTEQGHDRLLIGYAAVVPSRFGPESLFSHHIYRVRPKTDSALTADYLCHLLNTSVMHDIVSGYANGTTVNMLPIDGLQSPVIIVPPLHAVATFSGIAGAARMRHEQIIEESRILAAVRDALLPKLLSGALKVNV